MEIGEKIKAIRKSKGISQKELAEKLGVSQANFSQYEARKRNAKIGTLQKIADALEVPLSEFIPLDIQENKLKDEMIFKIADRYGFPSQAQMMIEECSELIKAICKWNRKYYGSFKSESSDCPERTEIIGELADVIIRAKQLTYLLSAEDEVEHMIEFKLDWQLARMEGENVD